MKEVEIVEFCIVVRYDENGNVVSMVRSRKI